MVKEYGKKYDLPYVILRPGYVFGPGKTELNGRVAINTFGFFIQVNGSHLLPLTFVDNCAEAIVLAGLKPGVDGEIFNVVDDELPTGRQFLKAYKKKVGSLRHSGFLTLLGTPSVLMGEIFQMVIRASFLLFSIAAAARLNGKEIATPIGSFSSGWAGSQGCRWNRRWRHSWASLQSRRRR